MMSIDLPPEIWKNKPLLILISSFTISRGQKNRIQVALVSKTTFDDVTVIKKDKINTLLQWKHFYEPFFNEFLIFEFAQLR